MVPLILTCDAQKTFPNVLHRRNILYEEEMHTLIIKLYYSPYTHLHVALL